MLFRLDSHFANYPVCQNRLFTHRPKSEIDLNVEKFDSLCPKSSKNGEIPKYARKFLFFLDANLR